MELHLDRVGVGPEREDLANAQSLQRSVEDQLLRRLTRPQCDRLRRKLHRHDLGGGAALSRDDEPGWSQLAGDDHRLFAAVLQRELLELAALAADGRVVQRGGDARQTLRRPAHARRGR